VRERLELLFKLFKVVLLFVGLLRDLRFGFFGLLIAFMKLSLEILGFSIIKIWL
jgi:hypothetical protein